jgi:hydroxymethylpyrimidine/phosphomethylpyrimidine kinase
MKHVLSIAGSDSCGGAGIQADLKTMCAFGVYGMTAITAVTAQNTLGVFDVQEISPALVAGQIRAVFDDIRVDAVKVGMVSNAGIIRSIRETLLAYRAKNIVVDPVMVSKSGYSLLREEAREAVFELAAAADIITPNIPEAEILAGFPLENEEAMKKAAELIASRGPGSVLIKGGHRTGEAADLLFFKGRHLFFRSPRIDPKNTHGTGWTLSAAFACRLALGDTVEEAVRAAKDYISGAIKDAYGVGGGAGPVGHLAGLYRRAGLET